MDVMNKKIDRIDDKIDHRSNQLENLINLNSQYINQSFEKISDIQYQKSY